jgi:hypothetical protein
MENLLDKLSRAEKEIREAKEAISRLFRAVSALDLAGGMSGGGRKSVRGSAKKSIKAGVRKWTPAQRRALSLRMKKFHAAKAKGHVVKAQR